MRRSISLKGNMGAGYGIIKQKETWKKVCALACGNLLGSVGVMLTNKLTNNSSRVLQYGAGTLSSGAVAIMSFGLGYENVGMGSAMVSAGQALNTATSLVFDKSIAELMR